MPGKDSTDNMKAGTFFKKWTNPLVILGYGLSCLGLFLYSYTQVDLSLTLSRVSIWQAVQKVFQHIGYYQRPTSTILFGTLLLIFFILYFLLLASIRKKYITKSQFWKLVGVVTLFLVFSYPAFSYDMFNYMFTAKTVLVYHKNPYDVVPLQFAGIEPWLSFMHWTHQPSAYTPLWILLTLPAYALGFGFFLFIMWNIKILVAVFYLVAVWLIGKILSLRDSENEVLGMAVFALNPLILIETLVSGHNDVVMMALALGAMYMYLRRAHWASLFILGVSAAAKLMTIFLLPMYIFRWNRYWALGLMLFGFLLVLTQREVLPWYWVWIVPFIALIPRRFDWIILSSGVSLGLLLRYAPFLYFGNWDPPAPIMKEVLTYASIGGSLLIAAILRISKRHLP